MSYSQAETTAVLDVPEAADRTEVEPKRRRFTRVDAGIMLVYLLLALFVYAGLWVNLGSGYLISSGNDQNMWEWFFAVTADSVWHLHNPLISDLQNYPFGVNLMANTAMLGVGIPLFPITLLFGPTVTWAIALTAGLTGTATAWYWVFSRHLVRSRVAAAIGGGFCGFAPAMISHGTAHPNFVAWFLIPFIVLRLIRLAQGARPIRDGVIVGLLLAYQIFLGEEPLLIAMLGFVVFALGYVVSRPREAWKMVRPMAAGLGVGAVVAVALVAYPLWWQFFGPQSYKALEHGPVGNDTAAFTRFATESIGGDDASARDFRMNPTEENAFFGWPLIVLMVVVTIWLWRIVVARAIAIAMFGMAWFSLGVQLVVSHHETGIPGPWKLLADLPLFESLLESRLAMACIPAVGALLAIATDRVFELAPSPRVRELPIRLLWLGAVAAVLVPIAPTQLEVTSRDATPRFFADGTWRQYVDSGGSVVTVPLPNGGDARALRWQVDGDLGFPLADGYFVGPRGPDDKRGRYGAYATNTASLLAKVRDSGKVPEVDDADRAEAVDDLRHWKADVVVLPMINKNQAELRSMVALLLRAPGQLVDGVWLWDVRALTP